MQRDFFVQRSVLQDHGNVIAEDHERLEALVIEGLAGLAMTEEKPAADLVARVQRDDHFGADSIERAPEQFSLRLISSLREMRAADEVRVQLKPTNERIAFAVFKIVCLRQTTQAGSQPIALARAAT